MTTASIFAKAGLIARAIVGKWIVGCIGYGVGMLQRIWYRVLLQADRIRQYERKLNKARGIIEEYDEELRLLDKSDEELGKLEEKYKKKVDSWSRRASKD